MTDTTERQAFRAEVMELVGDLGRLCRWVVDRPEVPIPSMDLFSSHTYWILAMSRSEFDRLADVLSADGVVERESNPKFRLVRRRFGRAALEVTLSTDGPPFDQDSAPVVEGEAS